MDGVRRIAEQHQARAGDSSCPLARERVQAPRAEAGQFTEARAPAAGEEREIGRVVQGRGRRGVRGGQALHADVARAALRNESQRPLVGEMFEGPARPRLTDIDLGHDRLLPVVEPFDRDGARAAHG